MSISLSQVIWTVICFILFALVLDRLLIRPVLDHMDRRREKVEGAHRRRAELEEARLDAEQKARENEAARRELAAKENAERLAETAAASERELEKLTAELKSREESVLAGLEESAAQTDEKLEAAMDGMIDAFTEKLMTGGEF